MGVRIQPAKKPCREKARNCIINLMSLGEQIEFYESDISFLSMSVAFKLSAKILIAELNNDDSLNPYHGLSFVDKLGINDKPRVVLYLLGMSIELALKALIIKTPNQQLTQDDKHNLKELFDKSGFRLDEDQIEMLKFLTPIVQWAGKYPIPIKNTKKNQPSNIDIFSPSSTIKGHEPYWIPQKDDEINKHPILLKKAQDKVQGYRESDIKILNSNENKYSDWLVKNSQRVMEILESMHDPKIWITNLQEIN